ncbi:hypothetical protein B0H14DRAFT_2454106, partial [Mycena olivaceomarginata]
RLALRRHRRLLLPLPPQIHPPRRGRRRLRPHGRDPRRPRPQRAHPPAPRPRRLPRAAPLLGPVFQSSVIRTLTHLDLVDTRISGLVLGRVAHAAALVSLTLHGTFEDAKGATVIFAGDHVLYEGERGATAHAAPAPALVPVSLGRARRPAPAVRRRGGVPRAPAAAAPARSRELSVGARAEPAADAEWAEGAGGADRAFQ